MEVTTFAKKLWLSSPTMHGEEIKYVQEAYETNWMSTVGANINEVGWFGVIGTSLLAGILSLLTSVAGLPEMKEE